MTDWDALDRATRELPAPLAAADLVALDANAADLVRRARGTPVRVATKSVRCRAVLDRVLARPGFRGLMAYSLAEALWLAEEGADDVLVAYPSVDRSSLARLARDERLAAAVTVVVDDPAQLDLVDSVHRDAGHRGRGHRIRVCVDVDASLRVGPIHLGARRSPVRSVEQAVAAARDVAGRDGAQLVGLMFYDAQIAGLPDRSAAVRAVKRLSARELLHRRAAVVQAVSRVAPLELVNGGGTGSLDVLAGVEPLTELAAGSGLFGPTLFDGYRDFTPRPALGYALDVTRRPAAGVRTLFGGGYVASGPAGRDRLPTPVHPSGLTYVGTEGPGEVQTPVRGRAARALEIGDRVWWRHAKAGEVCERFDRLHLVDTAAGTVTTVPTYRGEGRCFG